MLGFHVALHVLPGFNVVLANNALESFSGLLVELPDSQHKAFVYANSLHPLDGQASVRVDHP